MLVKRNWC